MFAGGDTHAILKAPWPDYVHSPGAGPYPTPIRQVENYQKQSLVLDLDAATVTGVGSHLLSPYVDSSAFTPACTLGSQQPVGSQYGSSIILHTRTGLNGPLVKNRIIAFGGSHGQCYLTGEDNAGHRALRFVQEWDNDNSLWVPKQPLVEQRVYQNAVMLPDRTVFIVGGRRGDALNLDGQPQAFAAYNLTLSPVNQYEIYNPGNNAGDCGNSTAWAVPTIDRPRAYHSLAFLVPDGRVFVCGGEDTTFSTLPSSDSIEVYSPPYLFAPRPSIIQPPALIGYLTNGAAPFTFTANVRPAAGQPANFKVVLMRPASVTHHFDFEQRYLELSVASAVVPNPATKPSLWSFTVDPPSDPTLMPPGLSMLFVVDNGIPSVAAVVRLQ